MEDKKQVEIKIEESEIQSETVTEEEFVEVVGDTEEVYNEKEEDVK